MENRRLVPGVRKRKGQEGGVYDYQRAIKGTFVMELFCILSTVLDTQTYTKDRTV